jgi:transmembrane sensor
MITNDEQVRARIAEQAAEWFVANDAGQLDADESAALVVWLQASPLHVEEFLRIAGRARDMGLACADPRHSAEAILGRVDVSDAIPMASFWSRMVAGVRDDPTRRWRPAAVAAAAFGVVGLGILLSWSLRPGAPVSAPAEVATLRFATGHGEQQSQRLADNSLLHLNTDTAVTVRYSSKQRLVTLASGEAAFEVTHDSGRSFRVLAGAAEVVDLGTTFDVRLKDRATLVTVVEGSVAVAPAPAAGAGNPVQGKPVELHAGQQINVAEGAWSAVPVAVDARHTTAWMRRQIVFDGQPLGQVVAEFNRYASKPIEITTPALQGLEISGVFRVDDSDAFLAFLRSLEGVQVEVTDTRVEVSQK